MFWVILITAFFVIGFIGSMADTWVETRNKWQTHELLNDELKRRRQQNQQDK